MSRHAVHIASLVGAVAGLVAAPAAAQIAAPDRVPGTGGDPVRSEMIYPSAVDTELPVLALSGGDPADTAILFDGFELPWLFHPGGVRSIVPPGSLALDIVPGGMGVEFGPAGSMVAMTTRPRERDLFAELTPLDFTAHSGTPRTMSTVRFGWNRALRGVRGAGEDSYLDGVGRWQKQLARHWLFAVSAISSMDDDRAFTRFVLGAEYTAPQWRAVIAVSPMQQLGPDVGELALDTRGEVFRRVDRAAGLTLVEWRIGQQTSSSHWDLADGTRWTHDVGLWSSIGANLSSAIRADVGLRVDSFNGDVATQPRGSLLVTPRRDLFVGLIAGAYRRAPRQPAELALDLNPERATQLVLAAAYVPTHAWSLVGRAYHTDRTRLVAPDQLGNLHNTGVGTSRGVELIARGTRGAWSGQVGMALTSSTRVDYPRAAEHPAAYEQPFRLDALGSWKRGGLVLSARLRLASGLPYTPYPGAVYDSDTDTYDPLYVPPLSARTPFHHQVDLRADYRKRLGYVYLDAFLDLHNVYRNEDAIGYAYSFDYSTRTAITALPLFPFVGLRVTL